MAGRDGGGGGGGSQSAVNVAIVRALLTDMGVVDDPHARAMLPRDGRRMLAAMRRPGLRHLTLRHPSIPYLAVRTLALDRFVTDALDRGCRQVVIGAAGYDSRAWRLARAGVTFLEVDREATQARKRTHAPAGGPTYVPADVTDPGLAADLVAAGLDPTEPVAITLEGVAVYLRRDDVAALLARLHDVAAPGSRLAISFELGFERQAVHKRVMTVYSRRNGEDLRFRLPAAEVAGFLADAGWTVDEVLTEGRLDTDHLTGTPLAGRLVTSSSIAVARRS